MYKINKLLESIYNKLASKVIDVNELPILRDYMDELVDLDVNELRRELANCEESYKLYKENL